MATRSLPKIDFAVMQERIASQFRGLNPNDPASWPVVPRYALCLALMVLIVVVLWFVWLSTSDAEFESERNKETQLREDYKKKLGQAVNLDALKKQREQVQQYVTGADLCQGVLRGVADHFACDRSVSRYGCLCRRYRESVADCHAQQPLGRAWARRCAGDGCDCQNLSLPR